MTNFEKWMFYMRDCTSPEQFIRWGLYSVIASTLQRRVWTGSPHFSIGDPIYPNMYIWLVAEPGIGKGLVIKPVKDLLNYWKRDGTAGNITVGTEGESEEKTQKKNIQKESLIAIGADATTCEALISDLSKASRPFWYMPEGETKKKLPYFHASLSVNLSEISTMFKKHTENLVNFLLEAYDCSKDFKYKTIGRGEDHIHNCCLNLFGGTTPGFIKKTFGSELFDEGFASRSTFIFAEGNRDWRARSPEITPEQETARLELLQHIKKLTTLFGEVRFHPDAIEFLESWWRESNINPETRPNTNPKLKPYYARKNITAQKLAMAIHFMEHTTMEVSLLELQQALAILAQAEQKMHMALSLSSKNPMADVTTKIIKWLMERPNGATKNELWAEFYEDLPGPDSKAGLDQVLEFALSTGKLKVENQKYKVK